MTKAHIIDGRVLAAQLRRKIRAEVSHLKTVYHVTPGLAVVLVGEDPASQIYVRSKAEQTEEAGMKSFVHRLPADVREADVLTLIHGLNKDYRVNGILVQLPLPPQISSEIVLEAVDVDKDVDGFHVENSGRLLIGGRGAIVPCTPAGCLTMIKSEAADLAGMRALVVGRSNIVGKTMALLMLNENCTVTIAHSRTRDLADECRRADILVAAAGKPRFIKGEWIKPGAIVIDVGINRIDAGDGKTRLVGDVEFQRALDVAGAITPVPGGVGPMTVAGLLGNTVVATCRQHGIEPPAF